MCVCEREREGGRMRGMGSIHHYHITTPPSYRCTYRHTSTNIFTPHCSMCEALWNRKTFQQTRLFAVKGSKEPPEKERRKKRRSQLHWCVCTDSLNVNDAFFYLLFFWHTKKGINSSPVCFLGFPKHFLCIIHTGPSASRISCLSWTQDKSTHCRAHSTQTFQNMCWRVMPAGFRSKLHVMHPHTQSKGRSNRSFP